MTELRPFSIYAANRSDMSAKAFIHQFESEALLLAIPSLQRLHIFPFVLKRPALVLNPRQILGLRKFQIVLTVLPF